MEKKSSISYTKTIRIVKYSCIQKIQFVVTIKILYGVVYNMLIIRRFSHRHSRSFFVPNCKPWRENPMRENPMRENPMRENPMRENPMRENPLNECEKPFVPNMLYKKIENPLNECETPFVRTSFSKKIENPLNESEKPFVPSSFYKNRKSH